MSNFMRIEFPEKADEFLEGIILLDEAVGRFSSSDNQHAETLERIIAAIVREFDYSRDEEDE